ncbi:S-adenosylmethionine synthase, partial [Clarias magur]
MVMLLEPHAAQADRPKRASSLLEPIGRSTGMEHKGCRPGEMSVQLCGHMGKDVTPWNRSHCPPLDEE